ncbi:MAG TPA: phosphatase PAP2 family protein, partial [Ottowia sp.]|nr:phosphatase PAP2 family protein [Ottowia sp.]
MQPAFRSAAAALAAITLLGACTSTPHAPDSPAEVGELRPGAGYLKGYLGREELPDSLALLPPPPADGTPAHADDADAFRQLTALQKGARGTLATRDANLKFPQAAGAFACALGVTVSEQGTPHLNMLLRRTLTDAGLATYKAKDQYKRTRPFVAFSAPTCTPAEEAALSKDGSYPSGHSALGWAWALVLTELAPERADALLLRGRSFGQSRGICGVHWKSDIEAG